MSLLRNSVLGLAVTSAAAFGAVEASAAPAVPPSGTYFGTLSISRSTGRIGLSVDQRSWVSADAVAIDQCGVYDCHIELRYSDSCAAVARAADGRFGWATAPSKAEAEQQAVAGLGESAPPFPDLGSASPRAADIVATQCAKNAQ
ncbi:DUF4189 domain-containing protein [Nocardia arthritidis]|uniref:DUF4189 domain-containing protein n=1 Tax=Nocardia arthritidis TaxID=228602 RepID=UPI00142DE8CF|nr:DUF4189 domain-containing protein [Nocardia arthritidis]